MIEAFEPAEISRLLLQLSDFTGARVSSSSLNSALDLVTRKRHFFGLAISCLWVNLALVLDLDRVGLSFNLHNLVGCALLDCCNLGIGDRKCRL